MLAERNLQPHPTWLNKCIQLYERSLVRHGIMLVGPSGAGKTTIMECLAAALSEMGQKTVIWRMNPKVGPLLTLLLALPSGGKHRLYACGLLGFWYDCQHR